MGNKRDGGESLRFADEMLLAPMMQSNRSARNAVPVLPYLCGHLAANPGTTMVLTKNRELGRLPGTDCGGVEARVGSRL